jgi:Leucine-rich repeat (LRR) protein
MFKVTIEYTLLTSNLEQNSYISTAITTENDTSSVFVSYQNLTKLFCKMLNITNEIDSLTIDYCNVVEVETECFHRQIQKVSTVIWFRHNNLKSIKKATFKNLKLEILNLMSNNIEVIEDEAFANLSNLEMINLMKNNLKRFNPNAIFRTPRLTRLDLGENFIE